MKYIKKIGFILLVITLVACAKPISPSEVFDQFIIAYKSQDQVAMNQHTVEPLVLFRKIMSDDSEITKLSNKIYDKLLDFDYEIISEEHDSKNAQLVVKITTYDFKDSLKKGSEQTNKEIKEKLKEKDFDDEKAYIAAFRYLDEAPKDYETTISIQLEKVKGTWLITNPKVLENAIGENYSEALNNIKFKP